MPIVTLPDGSIHHLRTTPGYVITEGDIQAIQAGRDALFAACPNCHRRFAMVDGTCEACGWAEVA